MPYAVGTYPDLTEEITYLETLSRMQYSWMVVLFK